VDGVWRVGCGVWCVVCAGWCAEVGQVDAAQITRGGRKLLCHHWQMGWWPVGSAFPKRKDRKGNERWRGPRVLEAHNPIG